MNTGSPKIKLKQISEKTGYSVATVSNVLRHKREVNEKTREKILAAASDLGYQFERKINRINLVMVRKSGLVLRETPLIQSLIEGVIKEGRAHQADVVISYIDSRDPAYDSVIGDIIQDVSCGVILVATEMDWEELQAFESRTAPLVVVDACFNRGSFPCVLMENYHTMADAVDYLVQKGHREIGFIGSTVQIQNFLDREAGFQEGMRRNGLELRPEYRIALDPTIETAKTSMRRYLGRSPKLASAYVAVNDIIAFGAVCGLQDCGYRVPDQVSVIGFDNMPFGAILTPKLTTYNVLKEELGLVATKLLFEQKMGPLVPMTIYLKNKLVERESVRKWNG